MFLLDRPVPDGPLVQGELLAHLVQYRVDTPPIADQAAAAVAVQHPLVVVLTQICDLQHDFKARFHDRPGLVVPQDYRDKPTKHLLEGVLLCKADREINFRDVARGINAKVFADAQRNQHERYHYLGPLRASHEAAGTEYPLFLDFKRLWLCPPSALYAAIHAPANAHRVGIIPAPYLEHLMQRFYAFHGRVGLPDPENDIPYKVAALPAGAAAEAPRPALENGGGLKP